MLTNRCFSEVACEYAELVHDKFLQKVYGLNSCLNRKLYDDEEDYKLYLLFLLSGYQSVDQLGGDGIDLTLIENIRGIGNYYTINNITNVTNNYTTINNFYEATGYVHIQLVPSTIWVVTHGLGFCPNVSIVDDNGTVMEAQVDYNADCSTITLLFSQAQTGKAYFS